MGKRKLIFYNDARHYHMYCYEPPMRIEDAYAPIDEVAGTGVDTFVYGFGVGPTMFHNTKVGEIWGFRLGKMEDVPSWRAYENIKSLQARGLDLLDIMAERAHKMGMEFFGSLRLTHSSDPKVIDSCHTWQFKIDHPEWCLKGDETDPDRKNNLNWIYPEVRAERFALFEEAVNRYDLDGMEIDGTFSPYFFERNEVEQNTHFITEFVRDVRRVVKNAAKKRGSPMALGVRVLPTEAANLAAGMDVVGWLKEGLLDFVVPNIYGHLYIDSDWPFEWLLAPAHASGCEVYPALHQRTNNIGMLGQVGGIEENGGIVEYRAGAAGYWEKGADALYLPWFPWPIDTEQRSILCEIGDPTLIAEKSKRYVVPRTTPAAVRWGRPAQLPMELKTGDNAPGQIVYIYVADNPRQADASLKLRLGKTTIYDSLTVSVNGKPLCNDTCRRQSYGYAFNTLEYPLPRGSWRKGANEIGVALHSRPRNLVGKVIVDNVEINVTYSKPLLGLG